MPDGEWGEVVFTTLTREGMPLIRYRTGDISRFLPEPCPCGTVLKLMDRRCSRRLGMRSLGNGSKISMNDLDEALFTVPQIVDYRAALTGGRPRDVLKLDLRVISVSAHKDKNTSAVRRCLIRKDGSVLNDCGMEAAQLRAIMREAGRSSQATLMSFGEAQFLIEPFLAPSTLYLFGAGHVSQHTAAIASLVGFRTVVLDDRAEFANAERFPQADEIAVLPSFQNPLDGLSINKQSYLVIVTRGHSHDKTVLSHALKTEAGYIGMIGSRRKRDSIYALLLKEGFDLADLNRVHCPIGLPIGGETPEEIAVSIVAELIEARASLQRQQESAK